MTLCFPEWTHRFSCINKANSTEIRGKNFYSNNTVPGRGQMNAPPSSSAFMLTEQPKNREKGRKSMVFRTYDGNALALSPLLPVRC